VSCGAAGGLRPAPAEAARALAAELARLALRAHAAREGFGPAAHRALRLAADTPPAQLDLLAAGRSEPAARVWPDVCEA
jgi:hypothetical protein